MNEFNEKNGNTNLDDVDIEDSFSNKQGHLPGIISPPAAHEEQQNVLREDARASSLKKSSKKVQQHIYNTLNNKTVDDM